MQIIFKQIMWQNFLSTGKNPVTIELNKNHQTLIIGENGHGKSTLLDALCFGLFGKPFRKVEKPSIINSVNKKRLLVEIKFSVGSREYLIRRGMKPNIFEIIKNGEVLPQNAKTKDYQKILEQQILKLNFKSFTQIIILGSAGFTPFMQLPAAARREIIEDLLDIRVFSSMNGFLKTDIIDMKDNMDVLKQKLSLVDNSLNIQEKHMSTLKQDRAEIISAKTTEIDTLTHRKKYHQGKIDDMLLTQGELTKKLRDIKPIEDKLVKIRDIKNSVKRQKIKSTKSFTFYESSNTCPTCEQNINEKFKVEAITVLKENIKRLDIAQAEINKKHHQVSDFLNRAERVHTATLDLSDKINQHNTKITSIDSTISTLNVEIGRINNNSVNIEIGKKELSKLSAQKAKLIDKKSEYLKTQELMGAAQFLLKDTGIKSQIIKQYIPIINQLINKYLSTMEFFVDFNLDKTFKETIKSRYRDQFSYNNFSEGQKKRIDLAILFAWRGVARLKNSVDTNILIMDEIFDSSLDDSGMDALHKILNSLDKRTNTFIISHKENLQDKFDTVLTFEMKKNFTTMKEE